MMQIPQKSQGRGLACAAILRDFPPSPSQILPHDTRKQRQRGSGGSKMSVHFKVPVLLVAWWSPQSPACLLRPASCSRAHRSHLQWWRSEGSNQKRGSQCRDPQGKDDHEAQRKEGQPPLPALSRSESVAQLLWASVSQFVTLVTVLTQGGKSAKQMTRVM